MEIIAQFKNYKSTFWQEALKISHTKKGKPIKSTLIAPCGMNCRLCRAFIKGKNTCPGGRSEGSLKPKTRVICKITTCNHLTKGKIKYCSDCDKYPCKNLNHLDKRYRAKYRMSLIDNLENIKLNGIRHFVR